MDAGFMEFPDHRIVLFNLHEGFEVDIADTTWTALNGEQKVNIFYTVLSSTDLPESFTDGLLTVKFAIVIAEWTLNIATVGFSDSRKTCSGEAAPAAFWKEFIRADIERPSAQRTQMRNLSFELFMIMFNTFFDL